MAWIWEERTYSGHWEVKTGLSVPEYHEAEKWVRNARPLVYGCLAHPQAAGSAPVGVGELERQLAAYRRMVNKLDDRIEYARESYTRAEIHTFLAELTAELASTKERAE